MSRCLAVGAVLLFAWFTVYAEDKPQTAAAASDAADAKAYASVMVPKISDSKLKDLTWSLDIKESIYSDRNQK